MRRGIWQSRGDIEMKEHYYCIDMRKNEKECPRNDIHRRLNYHGIFEERTHDG